MAITVTPKEFLHNVSITLKSGRVPIVRSSPGVGKSALYNQLAKKYNLFVIDVRLAQVDPTELNGFPFPDREKGKARYMPMDTFPLKGDPIPNGYAGWLLLFDEITSAREAVQAAAYKIILDKAVNQDKLHEKCLIAAAGNLETDGAIVYRMSTALQSRMVHYQLDPHLGQWLEWAEVNEIDHRIQAYLSFAPENFYRFDPNHDDQTYPCSRTWEMLSDQIKLIETLSHAYMPLIAGTVGEGTAREFLAYTEIYSSIPTWEAIVLNPTGVSFGNEPSIHYALSKMISHHVDASTIDNVMGMIKRLPIEFQVITMSTILRKDVTYKQRPSVSGWISQNTVELFAA